VVGLEEEAKKMEKQIRKSVKTALIFLAIGLLLGTLIVFAATPSSTFYISSGVYPGAPSYTVWREGANYFAKDANGQLPSWSGGTNATEIIQNSIDVLTSGGKIFLQEGIYSIDVPLSLKSAVTLQGEGKGVTVIRQTNASANTIIADNIWQISIQDLTIDKSVYFATGGDAIYLHNVSRFQYRADVPPYTAKWFGYGAYIKDVLILNQINGIHIVECKWVYIDNVDIFNIGSDSIEGTGILIDRDTDFYLRNIWLAHHYIWDEGEEVSTNASGIGIKIIGGGGFYFEDVSVVGKYWTIGINILAEDGAKIWWGFFDHVISDTIGGNAWQIAADNESEVKGLVFMNCWGASSDGNGFYLHAESADNATVYGVRFEGCRAISNLCNGWLFSENIRDISLLGCEISDNNQNDSAITGDGIQFANVTGYVTIEGCRIGNYLWLSGLQRYGIYVGANCANFTIRDNNLVGNDDGALYIGSSDVDSIVKGNIGFVTENSGMVVNASATTWTITHGLAGTPTFVSCSFNSTNSDMWKWTSTSTTITVTATATEAVVACYWYAEYKP
jgi:hypothetical protein